MQFGDLMEGKSNSFVIKTIINFAIKAIITNWFEIKPMITNLFAIKAIITTLFEIKPMITILFAIKAIITNFTKKAIVTNLFAIKYIPNNDFFAI